MIICKIKEECYNCKEASGSRLLTWILGSISWIDGCWPQYMIKDSIQTVPAHLSSFLLLYRRVSNSFRVMVSLVMTLLSSSASVLASDISFDKDLTSRIKKFESVERELKFVFRIISAVTGTPPQRKDNASPAANKISSAWPPIQNVEVNSVLPALFPDHTN